MEVLASLVHDHVRVCSIALLSFVAKQQKLGLEHLRDLASPTQQKVQIDEIWMAYVKKPIVDTRWYAELHTLPWKSRLQLFIFTDIIIHFHCLVVYTCFEKCGNSQRKVFRIIVRFINVVVAFEFRFYCHLRYVICSFDDSWIFWLRPPAVLVLVCQTESHFS